MKKTVSLAFLFALLAMPHPLCAQEAEAADKKEPPGTPISSKGLWEATLNGGTYVVQLSRITSLSRQEYVLDGAMIVNEVTIDTTGQALARFYFIKPITDATPAKTLAGAVAQAQSTAGNIATTAGFTIQNMVIKKYPETTHARTIEYRILSEEDLTALYASISKAWDTNRGSSFTTEKK